MGQEPNQITQDIAQARAELGSNLGELEHKVKSVADWRCQFKKRPMAILGLAFGGGLLLSRLMKHTNGRRGKWRRHSWIPVI